MLLTGLKLMVTKPVVGSSRELLLQQVVQWVMHAIVGGTDDTEKLRNK
jgi:hypothetical protein